MIESQVNYLNFEMLESNLLTENSNTVITEWKTNLEKKLKFFNLILCGGFKYWNYRVEDKFSKDR